MLARNDHRRDIGLFRYSLFREAADPGLSPAERGELVRRLAARDHVTPGATGFGCRGARSIAGSATGAPGA